MYVCCSACASDICYLLLKLPFCTLVCGIVRTFARNGKGYALIARSVGSRSVGYCRLLSGGHSEMDESHSDWDPTTPSVCLIWYPELWLCASISAMDKNEMYTTSNTTFELLFHIYSLICSKMLLMLPKHSICHWYIPKHFICHWYVPKYFITLMIWFN